MASLAIVIFFSGALMYSISPLMENIYCTELEVSSEQRKKSNKTFRLKPLIYRASGMSWFSTFNMEFTSNMNYAKMQRHIGCQ